jgi:molybdenum cofactor synthesis domain-containing protein
LVDESPLRAAQARFVDAVPLRSTGSIICRITEAHGLVLYEDAIAPTDMPPYPRAIVEGFIVNAADTAGASDAAPVSFKVIGMVKPGDRVCAVPGRGEAVEVMTGSIVPAGAMAIVRMWEAKREDTTFSISRAFPPGFFIEQQGCDIREGSTVFPAGTRLGPWEVGTLASMGIEEVAVAQPPRVVLFSSGDEVIPHTAALYPGAIRDGNSVMLSAAVAEAGGVPRFAGIMRDDFDAFASRLIEVLNDNDMVVISGGTAAGGRDFVSDLICRVGELLVDGVPMKSGRPLIMGIANGKPIVGVAGHPPEALRGFRLFGAPALQRLLGCEAELPSDT